MSDDGRVSTPQTRASGASPAAQVVRPKRGRQTGLDMVRSLGLMLIVVFVVLFATPARELIWPSSAPPAARVDDSQQLTEWQDLTGQAALLPTVPDGWRMNAATMTGTARDKAELHLGWVSPQSGYLGVDQGFLPTRKVVSAAVGTGSVATGSAVIGGATWTTYRDAHGETFYVRTANGLTVVVAGSLPTEQLQSFATLLRPPAGAR